MIRMICGATRIDDRLLTVQDGPVCLDADTEARLVRRGVAVYVASGPVATAAERTCVHTLGETTPTDDTGESGAEGPDEAEVQEGELDTDELESMPYRELRSLAAQMGLPVSDLRSREALIRAITQEAPPTPGAEVPTA